MTSKGPSFTAWWNPNRIAYKRQKLCDGMNSLFCRMNGGSFGNRVPRRIERSNKEIWQGGCKHGSSSSMRPRHLLLIQSLGYVTCCILYMERNGAYLRSCTLTLLGEIEGQGHGKLILPGT